MKGESRREHNPVEAGSEEAVRIASSLAPLEEFEGDEGAGGGDGRERQSGAIVLDTQELKLPKDLMEEDDDGDGFRLEPVVLLILVLTLAFIAFIAYLISTEPPR